MSRRTGSHVLSFVVAIVMFLQPVAGIAKGPGTDRRSPIALPMAPRLAFASADAEKAATQPSTDAGSKAASSATPASTSTSAGTARRTRVSYTSVDISSLLNQLDTKIKNAKANVQTDQSIEEIAAEINGNSALVLFRTDTTKEQALAILDACGMRSVGTFGDSGLYMTTPKDGVTMDAALKKLQARPEVVAADSLNSTANLSGSPANEDTEAADDSDSDSSATDTTDQTADTNTDASEATDTEDTSTDTTAEEPDPDAAQVDEGAADPNATDSDVADDASATDADATDVGDTAPVEEAAPADPTETGSDESVSAQEPVAEEVAGSEAAQDSEADASGAEEPAVEEPSADEPAAEPEPAPCVTGGVDPSGHVTDKATSQPLRNARVEVTNSSSGAKQSAATDETGYYSILVPDGEYLISALSPGYGPITVTRTVAGVPITVDFELTDIMAPRFVSQSGKPINAGTVGQLPLIGAVFWDEESGIDAPTGVVLFLDGIDVTADAIKGPLSLKYRPKTPLAPGTHTVELTVRDRTGNEATSTWSFTVVASSVGDLGAGDFSGSASDVIWDADIGGLRLALHDVLSSADAALGMSYGLSAEPTVDPDTGAEFTDGDDATLLGYDVAAQSTTTVELTLDLGAVVRLGKASLTTGDGGATFAADTLEVLASLDGLAFTPVGSTATLEQGAMSVAFASPVEARYVLFRAEKTAGESAAVLQLNEGRVYEVLQRYATSGWYESRAIDTGAPSEFFTVDWGPVAQTGGTEIAIQVAGLDYADEAPGWVGPDGTSGTYFVATSTRDLPATLSGKRYIRYRLLLSTTDPERTPELSRVEFTYDNRGPPSDGPTVVFSTPAEGASLQGSEVAIAGTAADESDSVLGVFVSSNGGWSWQPAATTDGYATWARTLPAGDAGSYELTATAVDSEFDRATTDASVTVTVTPAAAEPAPDPISYGPPEVDPIYSGTGGDDTIYVEFSGGSLKVWINHDHTTDSPDFTDTPPGGGAGYTIQGGNGNDTITLVSVGSAPFPPSTITLDGGAGNDILNASGWQGDVTLIGGTGNDTMTGGSGNDIFVFVGGGPATPFGHDVVVELAGGTNDRLDFTGYTGVITPSVDGSGNLTLTGENDGNGGVPEYVSIGAPSVLQLEGVDGLNALLENAVRQALLAGFRSLVTWASGLLNSGDLAAVMPIIAGGNIPPTLANALDLVNVLEKLLVQARAQLDPTINTAALTLTQLKNALTGATSVDRYGMGVLGERFIDGTLLSSVASQTITFTLSATLHYANAGVNVVRSETFSLSLDGTPSLSEILDPNNGLNALLGAKYVSQDESTSWAQLVHFAQTSDGRLVADVLTTDVADRTHYPQDSTAKLTAFTFNPAAGAAQTLMGLASSTSADLTKTLDLGHDRNGNLNLTLTATPQYSFSAGKLVLGLSLGIDATAGVQFWIDLGHDFSDINGVSFSASAQLPLNLTFSSLFGLTLALDSSPSVSDFSATISKLDISGSTTPAISADLTVGFLGAHVTGTINLVAGVAWTGSAMSIASFASNVATLVTPKAGADLDVSLTASVTAGLKNGDGTPYSPASATVTLTNADPFDPSTYEFSDFTISTDFSNLFDFNSLTAADVPALLRRLASTIESLGNTSVFSQFKIPFIASTIDNLLDFLDGISDRLLVDDLDDTDPSNDIGHLLSATGGLNFTDAQSLATQLASVLGLSASDINATYDSTAKELLFTINLSAELVLLEFPIDFKFDLSPLASISSQTRVVMTASAGIHLTFGFDVSPWTPPTDGTARMDAFLSRFFVRGVTGDDIFATLSLRPAWLMNDCLIDAADNKILYVSPSIPVATGLQVLVKPRPGFTPGNYTIQSVGASLVNISGKNYQKLTMNAAVGTVGATGGICVLTKGVEATANFSIVSITLKSPTGAETDGVSVGLGVDLKDPDNTDGKNRITLLDIKNALGTPSSVLTDITWNGIDVNDRIRLEITVSPNFSDFTVAPGGAQIALTVVQDALSPTGFKVNLPDPSTLLAAIGNLGNFPTDFSIGDVIAGLKALASFLGQFESFGFLNTDIPLIGKSINDLIGFATKFVNALNAAQANPASSLQTIESMIVDALGLPVLGYTDPGPTYLSTNSLRVSASGDFTKQIAVGSRYVGDGGTSRVRNVTYDSGTNKTTVVLADSILNTAHASVLTVFTPDFLNFQLVDGPSSTKILRMDLYIAKSVNLSTNLSLPAGSLGPLALTGQAGLALEAQLVGQLAFGISLATPGDIYLFDDTKLSAWVKASGSNLTFAASLGPLSLGIENGNAMLTASASAGIKASKFTDHKVLLSTLVSDILDAVDLSVTGSANATLTVKFSGFEIGDLVVSISDLTNPTIDVSGTAFDKLTDPDVFASLLQSFSFFDSLKLIAGGVDSFLDMLQGFVSGNFAQTALPFLGDQLSNAAQFINDFRRDFVQPFQDAIEKIKNAAADFTDNNKNLICLGLYDLLGPSGLNLLRDGPDAGANVNVTDIVLDTNFNPNNMPSFSDIYMQWVMDLGGTYVVSKGIDFDLAIPGLGISTAGSITLSLQWSLMLGFGLSGDKGFYLVDIQGRPELAVDARIDLDDATITGKLAFLELQAKNEDVDDVAGASIFGIQFGMDVTGNSSLVAGTSGLPVADQVHAFGIGDLGSLDLEVTAAAVAHAELGLTLGILSANTGFPTLKAGFLLDFGFGTLDTSYDPLNPDFDSLLTNSTRESFGDIDWADALHHVGFVNIRLDLGTFISNLIGPTLGKIADAISPLNDIISIMTAPIPVISTLAGHDISLVDLAELFGDVDLGWIDSVAEITGFISTLSGFISDTNDPLEIPFGDFDIYGSGTSPIWEVGNFTNDILDTAPSDPWTDFGSVLSGLSGQPAAKSAMENLNNAANEDAYGFSFPLFDHPSDIFKLLMGKDIRLVEYNMKPFYFDFSYSQFFPIMGPLGASITGEVGIQVQIGFGYGTRGIREFVESDFKNWAALFNGFYLTDTDPVTGNDVAELKVWGGISAAAVCNLVVAEIGVAGGIFLTINFNLDDPDNDGVVYLEEMAENIYLNDNFGIGGGPLAIFDIYGDLSVRLWAFIKVDLFFFSINWELDIVPMTPLVTFSVDFYRGPQLAQTFAGGSTDLILNVGPAASQRVRGDLNGDAAETVIVTQGGDATHVNVTQNGVTQEYEVTGTIYAKGGGGDDVIDLSGVTANIPVVIDGGPGNDTIKAPSGSGVAILTGGPGNDTIVGGGGDDQIWGNEGDDIISDPGGNNIIFGDDGKVAYDSGTGKYSVDVVVNNADGSDTITGGPNSDAIFGAGGKDSINGGAGDDVIFGDTGSVVFKFGSITIYSVTNTEVSKAGDADTLTGGTGTDYIFGGVGNDIIDGGPDRDFLFGESGFDEIHGGGGNDDIFGDGWVLRNDPNHPYRPASGGDSDKIWGDAGDDYIWAGAGDDVVEGGADDDYLYGGPGADVLWGDGQNPAAGDGMDHLYGQTDNDKLYGGDEVDVLDGGEGDDILFGAFGVNSYESLSDGQKRESEILPNKIVPSDPSRDQDTLYWFAGADLLDGQGGSDHYILDFRGGQATAHVWVFDSGQTADGNDTMEVDGTAFDDIFLLRAVADVDGLAFVAMLNKQAEGDDKVERADYDNIEKLTVNGQVGNDKFFVDDSHAQTTLNGGAGQDTFQLGQLYRSDRIYPNVSDETQFVTPIYLQPVYADPFPRNGTDPYLYLGGDQFATVETTRGFLSNGNSVAPTTVNGGPGNDFFTVYHNQQVANLNGEAGDDTFLIKAFALAGSQQPKRGRTDVSGGDGTDLVQYVVNAPVNIDGGDGFDTVIVVGTEFGDDIVITKDGVYGAGLNVNFVNIESLQVDGAEGDDRFYVQSTSEKFVTRISGGLGNDTFTMAGDVPPIISNTLLGHSGIITHSIENGDGAAYNADLKIIGISANVADNEEPAIRITQTAGVTSVIEGSSTPDSYTIVLTREPTTDVIVRCLIPDRTPTNEEMGERSFRVDSSAPGALVEQDGSGVILTFKATGAQKWDIPQQVDVYANISGPIADPLTVNYDDTAYEGERYGFINHTVEQETGSYRGGVTDLSVASFPDPIQDWPPKLRYETTLTLSHDHLLNGDPLPYPFVAHELIGATLELVAGQGIGQRMLIKDNTADTVTLFGKFRPGREPATDGTSLYLIRRYHYLALPSVLVQVHDNDSADVAISQVGPISNDVDNLTDVVEGGATDRIAVRLCKEPTQQVQIQLHSTTGQVSFSSSVLTFNTGPGWDTPQYVTITAVNDSVKEGFHHDAITFEVIAGEGDGTGNQTDKFELTETPEDPDVIFAADVVERPDAFIGLSHLPKNGVVTSVTVTDKDGTRALTAGTDYYIESNLIVFLDADGQPKTLTAEITVVYDYVKPGYHPPSPNKLAIDTVLVDIADNEVAGVIITQTGGSTNVIETPTHEGDGVPWTDTYTVALSKAPVDDVYITITPQITKTTRGRIRWDLPQVKVSSTAAGSTHETRTLPNPNGGSEDEPSSFDVEVVILKFTTSNWATPQEVTVTARDDDGLPTMNSTGTVGVVDGGDTHVFAPSLHTVTDIQGPVFIEGAGGSGSLVSRNATMLPGERNVKEPASNVVAYSTTPELTTITVNRDDAMGFLVDFEEITDVTDNPQKLVNHTLEITSGSAIDQFRLIMVVEVDPSNSDNLVLTLNAPYILDAGDVIDTSTKYAVTRESLSFFVDESKCIDFMFVYDDDSPADSSGKIDILSTDDYPNNSTVAQFVTQMDARHLTGLLMGADLTIGGFLQPGGITYAGLEVVEINLGPGDNTFDIAHTHYRTDFQTWTMVNTGGGDDHVTVSISRTRYSDVAVAGSVGDSHSATPQIQITPPAGVTFATDELRGFVVEIKRGDDVFARREILHNTADTFTLSAPWDLDKDGNPLPAMAGDIATFWLEDGPLAVNGQTGDDEIDGSASTIPLVLFGSEGDDTLSGGSADDIIFGDLGRVDYYDEAGKLVTRLGVDRAEKVGFITAASNGVTAPADPSEWTAYVSLTDLDGNDPFTDDWYDDLILTGTEFQTVNGPGFGQFLYVLSYTADSLVLRGNFDPIPYDPLNQSTWRIPILPENQTDGVVRAPTLAMCRDRSVGGTDIILGRAGDDLIFGGAASDIIAGDSGATNPDDGDDIILGDNGRADWSLAGSPYDSDPDTIDRVRTLDPSYGDIDLIYGDGANDLIVGGTAGDFIFSGTGNDLVFGDFADVKFGTVSLTMSAAVLMKQYPLYATVTDDDLGGIDVIWGGDDEDVIVGGAYGDYLDGGMDDDLIFGDNVTLDRITTYNDFTNPRFRTVDGAMYGTNPATNDGQAIVGTTPQNIPALTGTPAWGNWDITLLHHEAPAPTPATLYGDDYIAGGGGDDEIFGQLGDDTIQGDGGIGDSWSGGDKVDAYRDGSGVLHITSSVEAATDGDDYIEGNGGADVIFGNLGQDDIIGGNSSLFSLNTPARRPDAADMLFGGAGNRATRNLYVGSNFGTSNDDPQIALVDRHARDADTIAGDNANIYRIVSVAAGAFGGMVSTYRTFNYDVSTTTDPRGTLRVIPHAVGYLDYTPGGPDYVSTSMTADIGGADEIHGESGDDTIYGFRDDDVLFGDSDDDDIIGGWGNDWISGGTGQDGILGDDGRISTSRNSSTYGEPLYGVAVLLASDPDTKATNGNVLNEFIYTPGKVQTATINVADMLKKSVNLTPFNVDPAGASGGIQDVLFRPTHSDDIIYGGLGSDFLHGGSGDDAISGAEALPNFFNTPSNPGNVLQYNATTTTFAAYDEYDPWSKVVGFLLNFDKTEGPAVVDATWGTAHTDGDDEVFGDLGNDWLVGGTGKDDIYGGWGDDLLQADDDLDTNSGANNAPDTHPSYEDRAYGGAGRDVLIANTGGDRLIDWVGEFNSYIVPFAPFGIATVSRTVQPQLPEFLYGLSGSDGADPTRAADTGADPTRNGEPEGELGLVLQKDPAWQDQTGGPRDPQAGNIPGGPRDVLRSASFNNGQAQGFSADSGLWSVSNGRLEVAPEVLGGDAASVFYVDSYLPRYYEVVATINAAKPIKGYKSNAYLIFDYESATNFKFAGIDISTDKLVMGHYDATGWHVDVQTPAQLKPETDYQVLLSVNGTYVTVVVNGTMAFAYTFAPRVDADGYVHMLNEGMVGIGANNSKARIDNVAVQVLPPNITFSKTADFSSAPTELLGSAESGTWTLSGGRYVANSAGGLAIDTSRVRVSASYVLTADATLAVSSGSAGFVFDSYGVDNFKFATVSASGAIVIGHYTRKTGWVIDATASAALVPGVDVKLGIKVQGNVVTLTLNGVQVLTKTYYALVSDGGLGLFGKDGLASFDSLTIKTNDPAVMLTP